MARALDCTLSRCRQQEEPAARYLSGLFWGDSFVLRLSIMTTVYTTATLVFYILLQYGKLLQYTSLGSFLGTVPFMICLGRP